MDKSQEKSSTAKQHPQGTVQLSSEDRARMARLYEEVQGRLEEMALIIARSLEWKAGDRFKPTFKPRSGDGSKGAQALVRFEGTEIICGPAGCGCYDYDEGVCYPC